jgi:hypothetical protein
MWCTPNCGSGRRQTRVGSISPQLRRGGALTHHLLPAAKG